VGQKVSHADKLFPSPFEVGQITRHRRVQFDLSLGGEAQSGGAGKEFGQRGQVERRAGCSGDAASVRIGVTGGDAAHFPAGPAHHTDSRCEGVSNFLGEK
jgi:hypothetical protein